VTAAKTHRVCLRAVSVLAGIALLAGCSHGSANRSSPPSPVPATALDGLLLSANAVGDVMGTPGMVADPPFTILGENSNLLPNKNCLGIWVVGEKAIYGDSNLTGFRAQGLQHPATGAWDVKVVQGVASYPGPDASRAFFNASADRWSKCTNHHVNMTLNGQHLPKLWFGNLTKTDTELAMPVTEGEGDSQRSCQRVLSLAGNIIIDVAACNRNATDQAETIASKIKERLPH
jgi:PknH-like protein